MNEKVTFIVDDLCCDSCMDGCREVLEKIKGINNIQFYFYEGERNNDIEIDYDKDITTVDGIKKAIESYGNGEASFYEILEIK